MGEKRAPCLRLWNEPELYDATFRAFWTIYPRKDGKHEAAKTWQRLRPTELLRETIAADVTERSATYDWRKCQGRYVPMAATYLNQRRWRDRDMEPEDIVTDTLPAELKPPTVAVQMFWAKLEAGVDRRAWFDWLKPLRVEDDHRHLLISGEPDRLAYVARHYAGPIAAAAKAAHRMLAWARLPGEGTEP